MWNLWRQKYNFRFFAEEGESGGGTGGVETSNVFTDNQLDFIDTNVENNEQTQDENQNEVTEEKVEQKPEENRKSIIEKISDKIFGAKEETKKDTVNTGSNELEEDISDKFTNAARNAKWSDEQIMEFAEKYNNKQLEELIPFLADEEVEEVKEEKKEVKEEKKITDTLEIDEKLKPYLEKIEKALDAKYQEKIGKIEEGLKTTEQERSVKEASKEFPVFGTTDKLVRFPKGSAREGQIVPKGEAFEARDKVWKTAVAFHQLGMNWNESLDEALVWYKGKNLEKDVRSKVLKDLKNNEKRISPKRGEHSVSKEPTTRKALIEDLSRRAGID
jgi:hypothetical protein